MDSARHPILDCVLQDTLVPNDVRLSNAPGQARCAVLTGPNMGGKSVYIKTVALCAILAQIGSHVPCAAAGPGGGPPPRFSLFDAVHTRLGASDDLALGRSTFLEESEWGRKRRRKKREERAVCM